MTSKMNFYAYLSYFILAIFISLILFFPSTVNAATLTPRSAIDSYSNNNVFDTTGIVDSEQRPQENFTYTSTLNTTYSRKLYGLRAYFNYSLTANHTYRLSIYTALSNFNWSAFNYSNLYVCYGSSWSGANSNCTSSVGYSILSSDTIAFNFQPTSNYTYFSFRIGPQTMEAFPLTNDFTYRITSFTIDDLSSSSSNPTNQDVINNINQKTQIINDNVSSWGRSILNNEYQGRMEILESLRNTQQTILNNQNQNTQDVIDSINNIHNDLVDCISSSWHVKNNSIYINPDLVDRFLQSDGNIGVSANYSVTKYLTILPNTHYFLNSNDNSPNNVYFCLYDSSLTVLSCTKYNQQTVWSFTTPSNAKSIRFTVRTDNPDYELILDSGQICTNKLDGIQNTLNGISDFISDDTDPNSSSIVDSLDDIGVGNGPISSLVTLPITLLDKFEDGISSTCTPFSLGNLLGTNLTLPCIDISDLIGNNLWTIIDAITSIFMIYNIVMLIITAFDHLTSLSDDFDTLYTPDSIYESRLVKKRGYERHGD